MISRILRSRTTIGIVSAALGASVVGGFALAAIPQSVTTQITTCYPKTGATKTLRVIDYQAGQRCTATENTLSWQANGLHWRGAWSAATLYAKHDVVASGGSSYVAVLGGVNHAPPNATYWAVLAAQGPPGPVGRAGSGVPGLTAEEIGSLRWDLDSVRPAEVPIGPSPTAVGFDGSTIWVADSVANTVSRVERSSNSVSAVVEVGQQPTSIAFDGSFIWVANSAGNSISRIDPSSAVVTATVETPTPYDVAFDGTSIWVANYSTGTVTKVNPTTALVESTIGVSAVNNPRSLAYDGDYLWVGANESLIKVDPVAGVVAATLAVPGVHTDTLFDGDLLWTNDYTLSRIFAIDPRQDLIAMELGVGSVPHALAFDGKRLWIAAYGSGQVFRCDLALSCENTMTPVTRGTSQPFSFYGMAFDGANIWVSDNGAGTVRKLRGA